MRGPNRIFQGPLTFVAEAVVWLLEALEVSEAPFPGPRQCGLGQPTRRAGSGGWGRGRREGGRRGKREGRGEGGGAAPWRAGQSARLFHAYILSRAQIPGLDPSGAGLLSWELSTAVGPTSSRDRQAPEAGSL